MHHAEVLMELYRALSARPHDPNFDKDRFDLSVQNAIGRRSL
jgi:hypothetical protein